MKIRRKTSVSFLVLLAGILLGIIGCRKEKVSEKTAGNALDPEELQIPGDIGQVATWQSYLEGSSRTNHFTCSLGQKINRVKDPDRRMGYFKRFMETAFSFPLDATDSGTRMDQLFAFCEITDMVALSALGRDDVESEWDVNLRCLRKIKNELGRLDAYLDGKGHGEEFKGNRAGWVEYRRHVSYRYRKYDKEFSRNFGVTRTAWFLGRDKWTKTRSLLEELLGHKVNVWPDIQETLDRREKADRLKKEKDAK